MLCSRGRVCHGWIGRDALERGQLTKKASIKNEQTSKDAVTGAEVSFTQGYATDDCISCIFRLVSQRNVTLEDIRRSAFLAYAHSRREVILPAG